MEEIEEKPVMKIVEGKEPEVTPEVTPEVKVENMAPATPIIIAKNYALSTHNICALQCLDGADACGLIIYYKDYYPLMVTFINAHERNAMYDTLTRKGHFVQGVGNITGAPDILKPPPPQKIKGQ